MTLSTFPKRLIKGHALVYFLAAHTIPDHSLLTRHLGTIETIVRLLQSTFKRLLLAHGADPRPFAGPPRALALSLEDWGAKAVNSVSSNDS